MDGGEAPRRSRRVERQEKKRDKKRKRAQEKAESIGAELDWAAGESCGGAGGASDGAAAGAAGASLGDAGGASDGAAGGESSDEPFDNVGAVEMPEREEHDPQDADLRQYRQAVVKAYANNKGMPPFLEQDAGNNIEFFAAPLPGWNDSRKELDWDHLHVAGCARVRVCEGGEAQSEFVLFCDCCAEAQKVWHDVQIFHDTCGVQHSADCIHARTLRAVCDQYGFEEMMERGRILCESACDPACCASCWLASSLVSWFVMVIVCSVDRPRDDLVCEVAFA
jgi:hypothetical protein